MSLNPIQGALLGGSSWGSSGMATRFLNPCNSGSLFGKANLVYYLLSGHWGGSPGGSRGQMGSLKAVLKRPNFFSQIMFSFFPILGNETTL